MGLLTIEVPDDDFDVFKRLLGELLAKISQRPDIIKEMSDRDREYEAFMSQSIKINGSDTEHHIDTDDFVSPGEEPLDE